MSNQKPRGKGKHSARPRKNDAYQKNPHEQNIDDKEQENEFFYGKHVVFNIFNEKKQVNNQISFFDHLLFLGSGSKSIWIAEGFFLAKWKLRINLIGKKITGWINRGLI